MNKRKTTMSSPGLIRRNDKERRGEKITGLLNVKSHLFYLLYMRVPGV